MRVAHKPGLRIAAVLAAVAVVASACGDDGDDGGSGAGGGNASGSAGTEILGEENPATGTPVKIGLFNVEGGTAVSSPEVGDAAQAAADYANDYLGGIGGHPIEIVRCADKADGASAAACGNEFVEEGVVAVVAAQTAVADPLVPIVQGAGIPYIAIGANSVGEAGNPNAFYFTAGFVGTLGSQAVYAAEQGYETVVVIGAENPQLVGTVEQLAKPLFEKQGVTLELVTLPVGAPDAAAQVAAATNLDPDAISIITDPVGCQSAYSGLAAQGSTVPVWTLQTCLAEPVLEAVGESGFDGSVLFTYNVIDGEDEESQLYQAVMQEYAPDVDPAGLTSNGYVPMMGMIRALNASGVAEGDVTTQTIIDGMSAASDLPLPTGNGETFTCTESQLVTTGVAATICNSTNFITTFEGLEHGEYEAVDAAPAFAN